MIENSMKKAEFGAQIAEETSKSLMEIVSGINESGRLVGEIDKSSEGQLEGILQINRGLEQIAEVVQRNSATAEESTSAAEEMNGQATALEDLTARFNLIN